MIWYVWICGSWDIVSSTGEGTSQNASDFWKFSHECITRGLRYLWTWHSDFAQYQRRPNQRRPNRKPVKKGCSTNSTNLRFGVYMYHISRYLWNINMNYYLEYWRHTGTIYPPKEGIISTDSLLKIIWKSLNMSQGLHWLGWGGWNGRWRIFLRNMSP